LPLSEKAAQVVPSKIKQDSKKQQSFDKEILLEMLEMLQQMRLEKDKTEEKLK